MNISEIAIKRPVFAVMVTVALMVLGAVGYSRLGTDLFPDVSFPVVTIDIVYPGASPGEVEELVSKNVEDAVVSLNGIKVLRTYSREGLSTTILLFELDVDVQVAATEVRERIAATRSKLPQEIKEPVIARFDVSATPVLTYTLQGGGRSLAETQKFAKDVIKPAIEQVTGVATVQVHGGAEREIRVDLDLARIDALRLSPATVIQQLRAQNLTLPAGHFDEGVHEISVRTVGEFKSVDDIRQMILTTNPDGSSVRLQDVARVQDGFEDLRTRVRTNGEQAVSFDVVKRSGGNTVAVAHGAKAKLATLEQAFPSGYRANLIVDQSRFIEQNTHEVKIAIWFGGAMAILIILIFMLDIRSTLISAIALPTSVVATFFLMYILNFTINMITLLALSLAIGLLIDDAVVVRENISKHLERGVPPKQAALDGTKEIALSVLATTLTVVAVFVPVSFMSGMVGQFFRQFGLTITASVLVSLFVAFTLDPMLSSRFSKAHAVGANAKESFAWLKAPFHYFFNVVDGTYRVILKWAVHHKLVVFLLAIGSLFGMGFIGKLMGSEFVNAEDRSQFEVTIELPAGTSLEESARLTLDAEKKMLDDKRVITVLSTIGTEESANRVDWRVVTVSKEERDVDIHYFEDRARELVKKIPGATYAITPPSFVEGTGQREVPIIVEVRAPTYDVLQPLAKQYEKALRGVPGIAEVWNTYNPGRPEVRVHVDRDKAAVAGVPVAQLATTLRIAMNGEEAGKLRQGKDEIPIRVRLEESDRRAADDVMRMTIWSPKGPIALSDIAKSERGEGPSVIERESRERQIAIWVFPRGRTLGEIMPDINAAFAKIDAPPGSSFHWEGQVKAMNETNDSMGLALMLGVIFIYIVLASQFESFVHPFTIMLTLPLALVGAIVGLFLAGTPLAMGSMIGIILLMGLVTKNAILLLDRAIVRVREHGDTPLHAILEAGPERLRPILMTSAAMILGMLPTAIGRGEGSEFRAPMAIAVIGGVISSTLLSLVVVPAFYLSIESFKPWLKFRVFRVRPSGLAESQAEE